MRRRRAGLCVGPSFVRLRLASGGSGSWQHGQQAVAISLSVWFRSRSGCSARPRSKSVSFNLLHAKDLSRIQQKIYCPVDDAIIDRSELVRGYEIEKGRYVTFTDEELKNLEARDDHAIEITEFVPLVGGRSDSTSRTRTTSALSRERAKPTGCSAKRWLEQARRAREIHAARQGASHPDSALRQGPDAAHGLLCRRGQAGRGCRSRRERVGQGAGADAGQAADRRAYPRQVRSFRSIATAIATGW